MRLLITGAHRRPRAAVRAAGRAAGHDPRTPGHAELDLFDPVAVTAAARDMGGVLHLASRIQALDQLGNPEGWRELDRR
jgi:uncharacterized protein YbjT (DUF2867 family)